MWALSPEDLRSLLTENPEFAMGLLASLAKELRGLTKVRDNTRGVFVSFCVSAGREFCCRRSSIRAGVDTATYVKLEFLPRRV